MASQWFSLCSSKRICCNIISAASRTVNHYLGNDPDAGPMNLPMVPKLSKELSARLGGAPPVEGLYTYFHYK